MDDRTDEDPKASGRWSVERATGGLIPSFSEGIKVLGSLAFVVVLVWAAVSGQCASGSSGARSGSRGAELDTATWDLEIPRSLPVYRAMMRQFVDDVAESRVMLERIIASGSPVASGARVMRLEIEALRADKGWSYVQAQPHAGEMPKQMDPAWKGAIKMRAQTLYTESMLKGIHKTVPFEELSDILLAHASAHNNGVTVGQLDMKIYIDKMRECMRILAK